MSTGTDDPTAVEMVREHYRVECVLDEPRTRLYRSHVEILLRALTVRDREAHRTGYRTALDDVRSGSFISGPVHDALAEHDAQVAARALREAAEEVAPGRLVGPGWLHDRADRIERQGEGR